MYLVFFLGVLQIYLTFRSLIHFELIFVDGIRKRPNFIHLHVAIQLSKHIFWKDCPFPLWMVLESLKKLFDNVCEVNFWDLYSFYWSIFLSLSQYHLSWWLQLCRSFDIAKYDYFEFMLLYPDCLAISQVGLLASVEIILKVAATWGMCASGTFSPGGIKSLFLKEDLDSTL